LPKGDGFFGVFAHRAGGAKHSSDLLGLLQSSGFGGNAEIENSFQNAAPHHGRANFVIHAAFASAGIVTVLLGPILPILISRWSLSDERAGLFFTTQFCGQLAGCLSTGVLIPIRRRGYRLTFAIGFALIALGVAALGLGDARIGLVGTALYGYGLGLALTGGNLWVAEVFPQRRATAVSILNVTWTIGAIACGPLVMLAEDLHMLAKFLVGVALFHAICALLIGGWEIEPLEYAPDEPAASLVAPRTRLIGSAAFALGALFFLYVGTESAVGGWVAAYANRVESISATMSALTPAFFWAGLMTGRALAPAALRALATRKDGEKILTGCGLSLAALASSALLFATTYRAALACATFAGLGLACVYPILVGWLVRIYGAHARRFGSIVFATGSLGGATLPWLVGAVSTHMSALRMGLVVPIAACIAMLLVNGFFPERREA
jgi:MFS transporter, FHS family, glucose/mannose:H+ symporter